MQSHLLATPALVRSPALPIPAHRPTPNGWVSPPDAWADEQQTTPNVDLDLNNLSFTERSTALFDLRVLDVSFKKPTR